MEGLAEQAERVFEVPVRIGSPGGLGGLIDVVSNPRYATSAGLILYGLKNLRMGHKHELKGRNLFEKILTRMKDWVEEFF